MTSLDEVRLALDGGVDDLAHAPLEPIPDDLMQAMLARGMGMATTATVWGGAGAPGAAAANAKRFMDAGGIVAIATDFGCCQQTPGGDSYITEIQFLERAGMTPMQLIVAATRNGALLANVGAETGTIEAGKGADIIIVDGDPLEDLNALRTVRTVVLDGRVMFDREAAASTTGEMGPVAFKTCSRDDTWSRPGEEQMAATAWQDPRHRDLPLETRRQMLQESFYRDNGSSSLSGPWVLLTGLGQYPPNNTGDCGSELDRQGAAIGDAVEVWLLLYEPVSAESTDGRFVLTVRPLAQGFRAVQFGSRETYGLPLQVVDEGAAPLKCIGPDSEGGVCR